MNMDSLNNTNTNSDSQLENYKDDLKSLKVKVSQLYVKNLEQILKNLGKRKGQLKKQQCVEEIMDNLTNIIERNDMKKYEEVRKLILIEYAHLCEKKGYCFPTFESVNTVFNIPPAYQYISQLTDIHELYLSPKDFQLKFTLSSDQLNRLYQNNSPFRVLILLSEWKKGDNIINLPLETLSNESRVTINRQDVDLPNKKSSNLKKVFDITPYCHESKNEVKISSFVFEKTYLIVIIFCKTKPIDNFLSSLVEVPIDEIKSKMFKKQDENNDDDIVSTSNALSLQCPVSLIRIQIPTKFKSCMHLNCVDASSMFQMYSHFSIWHCPICNKKCDYKDLIIDGYIKNIIKSIPNNVSSVTISPEGEYTYQQSHESDYESDSDSDNEKKPKNEITVIDLTLDDDSDTELNNNSLNMPPLNPIPIYNPLNQPPKVMHSLPPPNTNNLRMNIPQGMNIYNMMTQPPQKRTTNSVVITIDDEDDNVQIIDNNNSTSINSSNDRNLLSINDINNNKAISNTDYNIGQYLLNDNINPNSSNISSINNSHTINSDISGNYGNYNHSNNNNINPNHSHKHDRNGNPINLVNEPFIVSDNGSDVIYDEDSDGGTSNEFEFINELYDYSDSSVEKINSDDVELLGSNINNNIGINSNNNNSTAPSRKYNQNILNIDDLLNSSSNSVSNSNNSNNNNVININNNINNNYPNNSNNNNNYINYDLLYYGMDNSNNNSYSNNNNSNINTNINNNLNEDITGFNFNSNGITNNNINNIFEDNSSLNTPSTLANDSINSLMKNFDGNNENATINGQIASNNNSTINSNTTNNVDTTNNEKGSNIDTNNNATNNNNENSNINHTATSQDKNKSSKQKNTTIKKIILKVNPQLSSNEKEQAQEIGNNIPMASAENKVKNNNYQNNTINASSFPISQSHESLTKENKSPSVNKDFNSVGNTNDIQKSTTRQENHNKTFKSIYYSDDINSNTNKGMLSNPIPIPIPIPSNPKTSYSFDRLPLNHRNSNINTNPKPSLNQYSMSRPSLTQMTANNTPSLNQLPINKPSLTQMPTNTPSLVQMSSNTPSFTQMPTNTPSLVQMPTNSSSYTRMSVNTPNMVQLPINTSSYAQISTNTPSLNKPLQTSPPNINPFSLSNSNLEQYSMNESVLLKIPPLNKILPMSKSFNNNIPNGGGIHPTLNGNENNGNLFLPTITSNVLTNSTTQPLYSTSISNHPTYKNSSI